MLIQGMRQESEHHVYKVLQNLELCYSSYCLYSFASIYSPFFPLQPQCLRQIHPEHSWFRILVGNAICSDNQHSFPLQPHLSFSFPLLSPILFSLWCFLDHSIENYNLTDNSVNGILFPCLACHLFHIYFSISLHLKANSEKT